MGPQMLNSIMHEEFGDSEDPSYVSGKRAFFKKQISSFEEMDCLTSQQSFNVTNSCLYVNTTTFSHHLSPLASLNLTVVIDPPLIDFTYSLVYVSNSMYAPIAPEVNSDNCKDRVKYSEACSIEVFLLLLQYMDSCVLYGILSVTVKCIDYTCGSDKRSSQYWEFVCHFVCSSSFRNPPAVMRNEACSVC
ncbi:hypothetical protein Tco_0212700 [Tanacetum coccineum]